MNVTFPFLVRKKGGHHTTTTVETTYDNICLQGRNTPRMHVLTQNVHLAPNTQQAEQAGFTRAESHETCQSIFPEN
jgi:hypothetical protein